MVNTQRNLLRNNIKRRKRLKRAKIKSQMQTHAVPVFRPYPFWQVISNIIRGSVKSTHWPMKWVGGLVTGTIIGLATPVFGQAIEVAGLDGSNGFSVNAGRAVSGAGDFNHDGIEDLIIGDQSAGAAGRSYVVFGKDTAGSVNFPASFNTLSLDGENGFTLNGSSSGERSGTSVSNAGDINGDGIDDVFIGAPSAAPNGGNGAGKVYIVFGRDTAIDGAFAANFELSNLNGLNGFAVNGLPGPMPDPGGIGGSVIGRAVSHAGDFNGDGIDDVFVGGQNNIGIGGYLVFGRNVSVDGDFPAEVEVRDLSGSNGFRINTPNASGGSGFTISGAGDVNGDNVDDIVLGDLFASESPSGGGSYVVFGRNTLLSGDFPAVFNLADLDGNNGFIIKTTAINLIPNSSGFGSSVGKAGDVNNDGIGDLIIQARGADPGGRVNAGQSYVIYGRDTNSAGNFPAIFDIVELDGQNGFAINGVEKSASNTGGNRRVSGDGDINGDDISDVISCSPLVPPSNSGQCHVVFGRDTGNTGNFPAAIELPELASTDGFAINGSSGDVLGLFVDVAGDINNDGSDDIIVSGRPELSYVVFGSSNMGQNELAIEKLINHRVRETVDTAAQLLVGTRYRVDYKVTNNSTDRIYRVRVFEDGQLVCNLFSLMPGQSKQPASCTNFKDVLAGSNNVPANVSAKVSGTNQDLANQTNAYYNGFGSVAGKLKVTHYVNDNNADTQASAETVNGNQAEILFRVENTGSIKLYRVKTYHDPLSPTDSGWQQQCFFGTMAPGQIRYCKRTISVTEAGLNKAFGRAQGEDANVSPIGYVNASNPTYFNVVLP